MSSDLTSTDTIYFFKPENPYGFLSQWYPSEFSEVSGPPVKYINTEQYMMAKKAQLFSDEEAYKKIMSATSPSTMRKIGRSIRGFHEGKWDDQKYEIVLQGNMLKFSQNEDLRQKLLDTSPAILAEASPWDNIWGIGISCDEAQKGTPWQGENLLGKVLIDVRRYLGTFE